MRRHPDGGAVAVEFALVVPLLLFVMLMMMDFGRLMYVQLSLNNGAKEGVRALSLGALPNETESAFLARVTALARSAANNSAPLARIGATGSDLWVCGTPAPSRTDILSSTTCGAPTKCLSGGVTKTMTLAARFRWMTPFSLVGSGGPFADFNIIGYAASLCFR